MLRNNKGFTLIELIAVVTIMAIIALIATPNIISMIDNGNKETQSNIDLFNKQMEDVQEQWDSFWVDKNDEN